MKTKFRTFLKSSNYYVKVTQLIFDDNGNIKKLLFKRPLNKTANTSTNTEYDTFEYVADADDLKDFVFEQCLGLRDHNHKLIYEGDIFKTPLGIGKIVYDEDIALYTIKYDEYLSSELEFVKSLIIGEVIGNIHENSSLLTGER